METNQTAISAKEELKNKIIDLNIIGNSTFTVDIRNIVLKCSSDQIAFLEALIVDPTMKEIERFKFYYGALTYYRRMAKYEAYRTLVLNYKNTFSEQMQNHALMYVSLSITAKLNNEYKEALNYAYKATESNYMGVNQNYADIVASATEFISDEGAFDKQQLNDALKLLSAEISRGGGYAKYYCTQGRLLYLLNRDNYDLACELIERAISLEDAGKPDFGIRISQYYHSLVNIKLIENKNRLLNDFNVIVQSETEKLKKDISAAVDNTLDILDNQKSKYFEILAFFASMVALIVSTVNIATSFSSPKESSSLLLTLTGTLTFSYSIFRLLMSYNKDEYKNSGAIKKISVVIGLSIFVIAFGVWLGLTKII